MNDTKERIRQFIVDNYLLGDTGQKFGDSESLLEAGILDSTGVVELVDWMQTTFGIKVADAELTPANLDSLSKLAAFVARKGA